MKDINGSGGGKAFTNGIEGVITYWPSEEYGDEEPNFEEWVDECTNLIMVEDLGSEEGGRHWHYYFRLKNRMRLKWVQEKVTEWEPDRVHVEQVISLEGVYGYLDGKKDLNMVWKEFGVRKKYKTGSSMDMVKVANMVMKGKTNLEIATKYGVCWINHSKGIKDLREVIETRKYAVMKERPVENWIFWGVTATGKTTDALNEFMDTHHLQPWDYYLLTKPKAKNNLWFNGYDGQSLLVLDEFDESWMDSDTFKQLTDKWIHLWEVKGGMKHGVWKYVVMTSNYNPEDWWSWKDYPSVLRRVPREHWIEYGNTTKGNKVGNVIHWVIEDT